MFACIVIVIYSQTVDDITSNKKYDIQNHQTRKGYDISNSKNKSVSIAVILMSLLFALNMLNSFSTCDSVVDFEQVFVYCVFSNIAINSQMHSVTNVALCSKILFVSIIYIKCTSIAFVRHLPFKIKCTSQLWWIIWIFYYLGWLWCNVTIVYTKNASYLKHRFQGLF